MASTVCHTGKSTVCLKHCCAVQHSAVVCHTVLWCSASTTCLKHYLTQVLCSASSDVCHIVLCARSTAVSHTSSVPQKYYCVPHSLSSLLLLSVLQRPDRSNGAERGEDSKEEQTTWNDMKRFG